jgi:hypothetical protein
MNILELDGYKYSKDSFTGYGFRAKIRIATTINEEFVFDIYTDDHNMIRLENVLLDRKSDKVTSLQIVNWTTKEQDDASGEMIDEWLKEERTFEINKYDTFQITGKGTVFTIHKDDHDFAHDISRGDVIKTTDTNKEYEVTAVEMFRKSFGIIGDNVGLLVKER